MMVKFEFLSKPIDLSNNKITSLYIENQMIYRNVIIDFYNNCVDEKHIIFSENYNPIKFKNNICFIPDVLSLQFPSSFIKKIYDEISLFSNTYLLEEYGFLKSTILSFFERLKCEYDFDFELTDNVTLSDLLKLYNFKSKLSQSNLLSALIDFITLTRKYSSMNCFVILNLHSYFSSKELELFYKEILYQNIELLIIENMYCYDPIDNEKIYNLIMNYVKSLIILSIFCIINVSLWFIQRFVVPLFSLI